MKKHNKILMFVASLLLVGVFFFPIWDIELEAPQYPEGIGMEIWVDSIEGYKEHDLMNINKLNSYVGMKPIEPDSIPELQLMPFIFGLLIVSGVAIAIWGNKKWLMGWLILFVLLALAGLADFYYWGYDYGNDLDPGAPIQVPGASYQPPILGTKKLMNITATSLPGIGFYISVISMGLAGLAWWKEAYEED